MLSQTVCNLTSMIYCYWEGVLHPDRKPYPKPISKTGLSHSKQSLPELHGTAGSSKKNRWDPRMTTDDPNASSARLERCLSMSPPHLGPQRRPGLPLRRGRWGGLGDANCRQITGGAVQENQHKSQVRGSEFTQSGKVMGQ